MREKVVITKEELISRLAEIIQTQCDGSQTKFARLVGVTQSYVSDILLGKRGPGKKVLGFIGARKVVEVGYEVDDAT